MRISDRLLLSFRLLTTLHADSESDVGFRRGLEADMNSGSHNSGSHYDSEFSEIEILVQKKYLI